MAVTIALCGCASTPGEDESSAWRPIYLALTAPMDQLNSDAELGRTSAQYALSIVNRYGLRGARPDPKAADVWLSRAWSARRVAVALPLTSGGGLFGELPASARPEVDLKFDLSPAQDTLTRQCLSLLAGQTPPARLKTALARGVCGGGANYGRLRTAWPASTSRSAGFQHASF